MIDTMTLIMVSLIIITVIDTVVYSMTSIMSITSPSIFDCSLYLSPSCFKQKGENYQGEMFKVNIS